MKRIRVSTATTLASLLAVSMLAGCGGNTDKGTASPANSQGASGAASSAAGGETANEKTVNLKVSFMGIQDGFNAAGAKDDTVFNDMEKKLNVKIEPVQVTWNDWQEKAKVWAASGQLPDIFPNVIALDNPALYASWARQGIIKPLPDDLSDYPNIKRYLDLPSVQPLKVDGKFYMVPRMTYDDSSDWIMDRPILYRKDWAAEAGYTTEPQSFTEFVDMIKAVLKLHPNAAGVALNGKGYLTTLFLGTFPQMANPKNWVNEDGKWIPAYASPKINEGLQQLRKLYQDGLLDKDFAIQKDGDGFVKFVNGQSFISLGGPISIQANSDAFKKANGKAPADVVGVMNIWPAADGKRYTFVETPYWSETYFSNKMDDSTYKRALQLIDYMDSEEYSALTKNGILGVDYKIDGDKAVSLLKEGESLTTKYPITNVLAVLANWQGAFYKAGKQVLDVNPDVAAWQKLDISTFNKFKQEDTPTPTNFDVMLMSTPAKDKFGAVFTTLNDEIAKVVMGKDDPAKMWEATLKEFDKKGLQDAINEVTAKAKEQGIQ
ncbi:extracellular solute-binding protein [Cohnella suwonensis]|uniref:Extracellular solute-binding protein n=1 Tax=Cohnella suwonensis TaxID=696072 RepID=A0ABW0M4G5_9BACL